MIGLMVQNKIRLFVEQELYNGNSLVVSKKEANYLFNVMRLKVGDHLHIFNNNNGEWLSKVTEKSKTTGSLECLNKIADSQKPPDVWLLFSPIKKSRTDFIVEKATEMGVAKIMPILTDHTNTTRISKDRLQLHAIEAAEQCGTNFVPEVVDLKKLSDVLDLWSKDRMIMFCDEAKKGSTEILKNSKNSWAILIGPEGGFTDHERTRLSSKNFVQNVSLGPRILRADTAVVAALTLWQSSIGDW